MYIYVQYCILPCSIEYNNAQKKLPMGFVFEGFINGNLKS